MFILITRQLDENILKKLKSLVTAGIDAYVMCDTEPPKTSKRILHITDDEMAKSGWSHHMSYKGHQITAWDKSTFFAYQSGQPNVWICEDDVYWSKPSVLKQLINADSSADLIAHPLAPTFAEHPKWFHWDKVNQITFNKKYWMATYNQLCRLSHRLLGKMHELSQIRKRLYFHEGMFGTLCKINGYQVEYLNSPNVFINFRWKPDWTKEELEEHKKFIVHPVKSN
jgi:hypothetical protein